MRVVIGSPDALCARIVENEDRAWGHWVSSFELSTIRGLADDDSLGARELIGHISAIRLASHKPICVDLGNGERLSDSELEAVSAAAGGGDLYLSVDDTCFPRHNSFSAEPNRTVDVEVFASRLDRTIEAVGRGASHCVVGKRGVILRTEVVRGGLPNDDAISYVDAVISKSNLSPDFILVHGVDIRSDMAGGFRTRYPNLATLSTLSHGGTVTEICNFGAALLIIPSLFTLHRFVGGGAALSQVLRADLDVGMATPPFSDFVSKIAF